jgi:chromosome segregation protein
VASRLFIKRLEMVGFKSFARRTVFNFDTSLTAIVGPNGCGKSNIIDAVRWVLGEQSARSLRGARMEDVIFHGSEREKPVGMSEVTLTFDNESGALPRQGPEVSLTRRLYRSGESEYLINRSPVRLKDITDVILDTGVTTGAYIIMEQGKIDAVLTARPTERMDLFEEAAGVRRYQVQKEETQRKLEATQQNLLRVGDIVGELKRQLDSLERQARHAEQFQGMKKRSQELKARQRAAELVRERDEFGLAGEEAARVRGQLEEARSAVAARQAEVRDAREREATGERAITSLSEALESAREAEREFAEASESLRMEHSLLGVQRKERESRLAEASEAHERTLARAQKAREEETGEAGAHARTQQDLEGLSHRVAELSASLEESRRKLTERRSSIEDQAESLGTKGPASRPDGPGLIEEMRERAPSVEWPLSSLFTAGDEHRGAVMAALGTLADAAVVETWEQARTLLAAWREQREAPLTLVVLEAVGPAAEHGPLPEGSVGWADDLVSCNPKYAPLARALLGSTAVREGEAGPVPEGSGPVAFTSGIRVSSPGIVFWPGRLPVAHGATGTELAMLLAAAVRELGELEAGVVQVEAELAEARRREHDTRVEAARLEARLAGRKYERESLEASAEEFSATVERLNGEISFIEAEQARVQGELDRRKAGWEELKARQEGSAKALEEARGALEAAREAVAGAGRGLDEARETQDELAGILVGVESRLVEAKGRYEQVQRDFSAEFGADAGNLEDLAGRPLSSEDGEELAKLEARLADMGAEVNLLALDEFKGLNERYEEYQKQIEDLRKSRESLQRAIYRLDRTSERKFEKTFDAIRENFHTMFRRLFGGGEADLRLIETEDGERGVEVEARPPGKRSQAIPLLSGGERALGATALLFALYMTRPSPFCWLDELDAPLDDANTDRFMKMLKEFNEQTQFILITHNKHSMEMADNLYGITMEEPGSSKIVSVRLRIAEGARH